MALPDFFMMQVSFSCLL